LLAIVVTQGKPFANEEEVLETLKNDKVSLGSGKLLPTQKMDAEGTKWRVTYLRQ
jgi:hypothetical protein